ncbi:GNAT family N-acetyltransferase [Actinophytocola sp.]|jgi:RimJ/RimL family protein N-acetyltransferase|uniref:GNAT family N-acetyltransferase n=1 Tax=Actinophytocola sp. TaxID=1872138 RepID=UPI002EDB5839
MAPDLRLEPWSDGDLELELRGNTAEMKVFLGGEEPADAIVARHKRFLELPVTGAGQMFRIALPDAPGVGSVGYWEREWQGEQVYEMGWHVLPEYQGRGLASAAVRLAAAHARTHGRHRHAHAYPKVVNGPSNGVCRKAGFTLLGEADFEFPKGTLIRCNDWRRDLRVAAGMEVTQASGHEV